MVKAQSGKQKNRLGRYTQADIRRSESDRKHRMAKLLYARANKKTR